MQTQAISKKEIITRIMSSMKDDLSSNQLKTLEINLYSILYDYDIVMKETALAVHDNNNLYYLNIFICYKQTEGKSEGTLEFYSYAIKRMFYGINKPVKDIREEDIFLFLNRWKKMYNISNSYMDNLRRIYNSFFGWLERKGYIPRNPSAGLDKIKAEKVIRQAFSEEEVETIKLNCIDKRELAIVSVLYSTGVRVSELVGMDITDVDFEERSILVHGKGNEQRLVYLTHTAMMHLKNYLLYRDENCMGNNPALFIQSKQPYERLHVSTIREILKKIENRISIDNKIHPHKFRRTMATIAINKGMPIQEVKEVLGHKQFDTTLVYAKTSDNKIRYDHDLYLS